MRSPEIMVIGHEGRPNYVGRIIPGLKFEDGRVVVATDEGDLRPVPAELISHPQAVHYARGWAVQTGRSVADIYIPEALR